MPACRSCPVVAKSNDDGSVMSDLEIQSFFGNVCSYEEEFREGLTPEQVAENQWEAIT